MGGLPNFVQATKGPSWIGVAERSAAANSGFANSKFKI